MAHVVVVGAGIAGLTAAYAAVRAGHAVTVLEAAPMAGGAIQPLTFHLPEGPLTVDAGAEAYASRSKLVGELIEELGLGDDLVTPNPDGSWLYLPEIGAVQAPKLGMWGIPGDPTAPEVVHAIGPSAAARAAQEFTLPMDTWADRRATGEPITVGALVADRFGPTVLERLVAPVVAGVHSADPHDVDIDTIAPGLLDAAIRHGSVAAAIAKLRAAAPPGAAVKTLTGGMHRLIDALVNYLHAHATVRFNTNVTALQADTKSVLTADGERIGADHIVLAVNGPAAYDLVAPLGQLTERPATGAGVALAVLVLDEPLLDARPRGTGMLVSPAAQSVAAKAATHVTAKWEWAQQSANALAEHRHVLRLSYGRITDLTDGTAPGHRTPDDELRQLAVADAAAMFGLSQEQLTDALRAFSVVRWRDEMPLTTPENQQKLAAITQAAEATDWLHVTGAWFAGTGLAAITQQATGLQFYPPQ